MKTLKDLCLNCLMNNLRGNISCIVRCLATVHKEILLERLVFHDRLTPDYLPHVTYNLFSSSLRRINFYKCTQVTDMVLEQLNYSQCQITHLTISDCKSVTDVGIVWITKKQTCLEYIELRKLHQLTAKAFVNLCSPCLRTVKLRTCNKINTEAVQMLLKKVDSVEELALTSCKKLDDSVIAVICHHLGPSLKDLNLRDLYTLSNSSLILLANSFPNLISLNLHGCSRITDEGVNQIVQKCTSLRDLDLSYCTGLQSKPHSTSLTNLPVTLQELSLVGVMSDDTQLITEAVKRLTALKSLRLCGIPAVNDESLNQMLCSIGPFLEKLDLSGGLMSPLTDDGISAISRHCNKLSFIGLSMLKQVTGTTLMPLLQDHQRAKMLKTLQLGCFKLEPDVLFIISTQCSALEDLQLSGVQAVNDEFLITVAKCCLSLKDLSIKACRDVNDAGICALAQYCPLECIVLSGVSNITDKSVYALANGCPYLKEIYVSGCSKVTRPAVRYLVNACIPRVNFEHRIPNADPDPSSSFDDFNVAQPHPIATTQYTDYI